jgi:hypothetical protein
MKSRALPTHRHVQSRGAAGLLSALCVAAIAFVAVSTQGACSSPDPNERTVGKFPDEATWKPVANMLLHRCGSLDCHGQPGRNLKLYGTGGLRLTGGDVPSKPTPLYASPAEYTADYASVCGLEPETLTAVFHDGGKNPERLTMVQKARNVQVHKGGTIIVPGDVQDKCLLSWLTGTIDTDSCTASLALP